jgi:hypothetical protein
MRASLARESAALLPAWPLSAAAPLVPLLLLAPGWGRPLAVLTFLLGSVSLTAYAFRPSAEPPSGWAGVWADRLAALAGASLASLAVFSAVSLGWGGARDWTRPIQALACLVPALCLTPYLSLATRKPVAAVVFTLALVGLTKLVAGAATCLVYGWDAAEQGRTTMPWEDPDFLLWVFWAANLALAAAGCTLGIRRLRSRGPERFPESRRARQPIRAAVSHGRLRTPETMVPRAHGPETEGVKQWSPPW